MSKKYQFPTTLETLKTGSSCEASGFFVTFAAFTIKQQILRMKYIRMILVAAVSVVLFSAFTMKGGDKPVYVFGVGASFKDSVVYFTEVQLVDSVVLDKSGFLPEREMYAYQLKNYLEYQKGKPDYTCAIYFSEHKSKLEKELSKVRKAYAKGDAFILENVKQTEFIFKKPKEY